MGLLRQWYVETKTHNACLILKKILKKKGGFFPHWRGGIRAKPTLL